jgi:hypothetical protein
VPDSPSKQLVVCSLGSEECELTDAIAEEARA